MKAKAWKHFCTITRHRHQVIRNCYHAGILWQGLRHDLSKYSPTEFIPGAKYFEYWQDYHPQTRMKQPVKMPLRYVKEMFCDRVAASKIYYGKEYTEDMPLAYYEKGKYCRVIHPETSELIESLLRMLKEKGEKETFAYIRKLKEY